MFNDQIVYVEEPIAAGVNEIQSGQLRQFEKQRQQKREPHRFETAAAEVIPQIHAEGNRHQNVKQVGQHGAVVKKREPAFRL